MTTRSFVLKTSAAACNARVTPWRPNQPTSTLSSKKPESGMYSENKAERDY